MIMIFRIATTAIILALITQHTEGFQKEHARRDNSFSDNVDVSRATHDDNGSGNYNNVCIVCVTILLTILTGSYNKLVHLTSNSLINITYDVTISSIIPLVGLSNITILGHNNPTVYCNNYGGLHFMSCNNCTIEGITWKGCGGRKNNGSKKIHPVLQLSNSSDIVIKYCWIQNSVGQAIVLSGTSGEVIIEYCKFLYNKQYRDHGTAIYYSSSISYVNLTIANCEFLGNSYAKSVVYIGPFFTNILHTSDIHIQDSSFCFNNGVPIYVSNQKVNIKGKMEFDSNTAENGGGIFISDYSEVIFQNTTVVNFMYNTAYSNGGAIYLTNHSRLSLKFQYHSILYQAENSPDNEMLKETFTFYHNRATKFGKDIYAHHSYVTFGNNAIVTFTDDGENADSTTSALYAIHHSNITFEGNSDITFKNNRYNQSGALCILGYSEAIFKGNATVKFYDNFGVYSSGAMYVHLSTATFKEYCNVIFNNNAKEGALYIYHSLVTYKDSSTAIFNNNEAVNGGAVIILNNSTVIHEGSSTATFNNNEGYNGGAMCIKDSTATFKEYSIINFNHNEAVGGGAMYITASANIIYDGNSRITFIKNIANYGGAVYIEECNTVRFKGNSTVIFYSNYKTIGGGAMYIAGRPIVKFERNSTVIFIINNAKYGGAMYIAQYPVIIFEERSKITFNNNEVNNNGGAIYITDNSKATITFKGNSTVLFNNNKASHDGGAIFISQSASSTLTFAESSKVTFNNNSADCGGAVSCFCSFANTKYTMNFVGRSTIAFNNNKSKNKGGAVCADSNDFNPYDNCYLMKFDNSSMVIFSNNEAVNGGAVYAGYNINIKFQGNSMLTLNNNKAHIGGAIYCYISNIVFQEKSTTTFGNNVALQNGGVLFCYAQCNISFTEHSTVTFTHNEAAQGGVIHIQFNSAIKFQGNSTTTFTENKAIENGGVIHSYINSYIEFDDHANVLLQSNTAKTGGTMNLYSTSITSGSNSNVNFTNNSAEVGGAIYIESSNITFKGNSSIQFTNNKALQDGGAIYLSDYTNFIFSNKTKVIFSDNFANDDGETIYVQIKDSLISFNTKEIHFNNNIVQATNRSIYINVPKSCNKTCLSQKVTKLQRNMTLLPIATSPWKLILYDPAKCITEINSDCSVYYISNIMLGQEIRFNACVLDYYDQPTELTQFMVTGMNHQHYNISGSQYISVSCKHATQGISVIGDLNTVFNYSINISMYVVKTSGSKIISVNLIVELSQCHPGFHYSSVSQTCEYYNTKNIISCSGSSSTIKRGYWFGSVNGKSTVASCPNDYCNFTCCEITNGIYHLSPVRVNQCRAHRSGTACGNCERGYTLSLDSPQCVEINNCTVGQTVLVSVLSILYWIAVIVIVFVMMHFKVAIGSLYAIMYYYSVVDILIRQASFISNGLYTTINVMSSLAKLTPQFLGQLCLVKNMSGIDQQFIHYVHPIVVSLILVMISVLARRSRRISSFISRGIIHFVCFLLLLSYTSVTTTSLLLMRSLTFEGINEVYTYLSPDVEYFHGRHLAYVITAIIFTITVVIGLPLLLFLEPFLNSKINFVKIKPLLDQFQSVYKDNYRCFAAYYIICRIVIVTLVIIGGTDDLTTQYVLISVCTLMALIHLIVRPYVDKVHNIFDGIILQVIIVISVLPIIEFTGSYNETIVAVIVYVVVILPSMSFVTIKLWLNKNVIQNTIKSVIIKCKHKYNAIPSDDDVEIAPINEITVDNSVRRNVTVVNM